jgi:DNA-binding CsgD family transcriptional regulator
MPSWLTATDNCTRRNSAAARSPGAVRTRSVRDRLATGDCYVHCPGGPVHVPTRLTIVASQREDDRGAARSVPAVHPSRDVGAERSNPDRGFAAGRASQRQPRRRAADRLRFQMGTKRPPTKGANDSDLRGAGAEQSSLTQRESQVLSLLAEGWSGEQIASELVLSPETVRTHIRHAMSKLGATTRAHAVALALLRAEIGPTTLGASAQSGSRPDHFSAETSAALERMLRGLVALHDIDAGGVYLSEEDGLSLRRVAVTETVGFELPVLVALGNGPLGRAALERRPRCCEEGAGFFRGTLMASSIVGEGRLLGMIALGARVSRPVGRSELLLLQAFSNRVGEVLTMDGDVTRRLARSMEQFRASWSATRPGPLRTVRA